MVWREIALGLMIFFTFIALHEAGHFAAALYFGLEPSIVFGQPSAENILGVVGVEHKAGSVFERKIVILSALIPPLGIGTVLRLSRNELIRLIGTGFLVLGTVALVPLPKSDMVNLISLL